MRGVYRGIFRVIKTLTQQICIRVFGADERNRTVDLLITNELLYQLSYIGLVKNYIRASRALNSFLDFCLLCSDIKNEAFYFVIRGSVVRSLVATAPLTSMLTRSSVAPVLSIKEISCCPGHGFHVALSPCAKDFPLIVQYRDC